MVTVRLMMADAELCAEHAEGSKQDGGRKGMFGYEKWKEREAERGGKV